MVMTKYKTADRAWIDIDTDALAHNVKALSDIMPEGCALMAVVKCEAYGHGGVTIATQLCKLGINSFAVATLEEGIKLREHGIKGEILILGATCAKFASEIKRYGLIQTIADYEHAKELEAAGIEIKCHLKIDTGMNRLGIPYYEGRMIEEVFSFEHLKICGIYSHFSRSDSLLREDVKFTHLQYERFTGVCNTLAEKGIKIPKTHIQSTYGLLNYPDIKCDYVRIGIGLYGVLSRPCESVYTEINLRPVLSLRTRVAIVKTVSGGEHVGYGTSYTAEGERKIAILSIGYGDGLPRELSCGKAFVKLGNELFPVIGNICMDMLAVDVTGADVSSGDIATVIGDSDEYISAPYISGKSGTITNELLCRLGSRVLREIKRT